MWNSQPHKRQMTVKEWQYITSLKVKLECRVLVDDLIIKSLPLYNDNLGGWRAGERVYIPINLVECFMNENMVEPVLPYWLRLDQIKDLLQREMDDDILTKPIHQYALEISEYFFELPSLGPWSTYIEQVKKENDQNNITSNLNSQQSTQSSTADFMGATNQQGEYIGGTHITDERKKLTKISISMRRKVLDIYQSWLKQRRVKIFKLLEMNGGLSSANLFLNGAYSPKIVGTLYQREHRWISPIGIDYINRLKMGSYGIRSCNISTVLCSIGLDFPGFLEKEDEIQDEFTQIFLEHYTNMKENCWSNNAQKAIDFVYQEADTFQKGEAAGSDEG